MITKQNTERVRVCYASGCYSKYNLWDSYKHELLPTEVDSILNYETYPEVREDLHQVILDLDHSVTKYNEYLVSLRHEQQQAEYMERRGKQYPYEENKRQLDALLETELKGFKVEALKRAL